MFWLSHRNDCMEMVFGLIAAFTGAATVRFIFEVMSIFADFILLAGRYRRHQ